MQALGVVANEPGLYFVGPFLYGGSSALLASVGRDAEHVAKHIGSHEPNGRPTAHAPAGARRPEAPDRARTGGSGS